ncbi:hypothetical protein J6590_032529 [Homalodisca vitripennis]|nr:hypothetical protein J6590_032529 [Homalodisca vitripennis]
MFFGRHAKYGNRLSRSTPHHFSSVFAYGASRSHRSCYNFSTIASGTTLLPGVRCSESQSCQGFERVKLA